MIIISYVSTSYKLWHRGCVLERIMITQNQNTKRNRTRTLIVVLGIVIALLVSFRSNFFFKKQETSSKGIRIQPTMSQDPTNTATKNQHSINAASKLFNTLLSAATQLGS
ncbi:MAG: hypothetical protein ABJG41_17145 [Cyclobacteriaceae bacterium]